MLVSWLTAIAGWIILAAWAFGGFGILLALLAFTDLALAFWHAGRSR